DDWISEPYGVREKGWISLTMCHPNRVQAKAAPGSACLVVDLSRRSRRECKAKLGRKHSVFYRKTLLASTDSPIGSRNFLPLNCTRPINANYACVKFYVFLACCRNVQAVLLAMGRAS